MVRVSQVIGAFRPIKPEIKDFEEENMSMTATLLELTLIVTQEIHVKASETTFEALLEQIGPENESPEQKVPTTWRRGLVETTRGR